MELFMAGVNASDVKLFCPRKEAISHTQRLPIPLTMEQLSTMLQYG